MRTLFKSRSDARLSRTQYTRERRRPRRLYLETLEAKLTGPQRTESGRTERDGSSIREQKEFEAVRQAWTRFLLDLETPEPFDETATTNFEDARTNELVSSPLLSGPKGEMRDLSELLSSKVVGQSAATLAIVPYVYMYQSGLSPDGRPAGVFLLLGPTGTGKTKTVEAIAELLHGSEKKLVKIDCGEFQMDHETAKLVGAPPGYLGHRETTPLLTQQQLSDATSENCDLALVLFDEIEKAAPSITALLLGILDKGLLRLGDNSSVNFEKSLIFFTSNLGAREMMAELNPNMGFQSATRRQKTDLTARLGSIALGAVRKRFSPEFVNRIDAVVTYQPLDADAIEIILDHDIHALQGHVNSRLGDRCFAIEVLPESRQFLLNRGVSEEYGARELKRTIHRQLTQPLATMVARGEILPGAQVSVSVSESGESLAIVSRGGGLRALGQMQTLLIVDDNHDLLFFLAAELRAAGWEILIAENGAQARLAFYQRRPTVVLLDYLLGEDDGLQLGLEFQLHAPRTQIILMTGGGLSSEEQSLCERREYPILYKPFLAEEVLKVVQGRVLRASVGVGV
jgi:ATP-dependent Clp protease ATP-binding subunit ClpA/CheY-like chemotaxis protein